MSHFETAEAMDLPPRSCSRFLVQATFCMVLASWSKLFQSLLDWDWDRIAFPSSVTGMDQRGSGGDGPASLTSWNVWVESSCRLSSKESKVTTRYR